jgi:multicomponent Na+:H+ antiporter subunit G
VTAGLLLAGAVLMLVAAVGLVRFPDVYSRMSATSKAGTLGAALLLAGAAWHFGDAVAGRAVVTLVFVYVTAPIAAHRIGRAAWRSGVRPWRGTVVDDLGSPPPGAASGPGIPSSVTGHDQPGR